MEEPVPETGHGKEEGCLHQAEILALMANGVGEVQGRLVPEMEPGEEAEEQKGNRAQLSTSTQPASDPDAAPSTSSLSHPSRPPSQGEEEEGEGWKAAQRK